MDDLEAARQKQKALWQQQQQVDADEDDDTNAQEDIEQPIEAVDRQDIKPEVRDEEFLERQTSLESDEERAPDKGTFINSFFFSKCRVNIATAFYDVLGQQQVHQGKYYEDCLLVFFLNSFRQMSNTLENLFSRVLLTTSWLIFMSTGTYRR